MADSSEMHRRQQQNLGRPQNQIKPGDWVCVSCGYHNFGKFKLSLTRLIKMSTPPTLEMLSVKKNMLSLSYCTKPHIFLSQPN
jgi:hypothetical protein